MAIRTTVNTNSYSLQYQRLILLMGSSSLALPLRAWTSGLDRRCRLLTATNTMFTRVTVAFVSRYRANYVEYDPSSFKRFGL